MQKNLWIQGFLIFKFKEIWSEVIVLIAAIFYKTV